MRFARVLALGPIAALLPSGAAAARDSGTVVPPPFAPKSEAAARALEEERATYEVINRATRRVAERRPSCRPPIPSPTSSQTHDVPSQAVLELIAALRRPPTTADAPPELFTHVGFGFGETYVDYVRAATAANGQRFTIIVARTVRPGYRISSSCLDSQRAELLTLLEGKPRRLRSLTLRAFGRIRHGQEQTNKQPDTTQDGIYLFTREANGSGGGGGGGNAAQFARRGTFGSQGGNGSAQLNGLVPDGVASVTLEYPKRVSRGRYFKPSVYPSAYIRTVKVQQNVLSCRVAPATRFPRAWSGVQPTAQCSASSSSRAEPADRPYSARTRAPAPSNATRVTSAQPVASRRSASTSAPVCS